MKNTFIFLNMLNLCLLIDAPLHISPQDAQITRGQIINDTIFLLSGSDGKYWDRIETNDPANNHSGEKYHWLFTNQKRLYEYNYKGKKRITPVYQGDLIIDHWTYRLSGDTLVLNGLLETKYLVKKLTKDSLVIQHFGGSGLKRPIYYIRSGDQKTKIN